MIKGLSSGLLLTGLLVGCSTAPPPEDAPRPPAMNEDAAGGCGAARVQGHVGHEYSDALQQTIVAESRAQRVRVIRPGQGYTMDYRPERLNIHLDATGRIDELTCG